MCFSFEVLVILSVLYFGIIAYQILPSGSKNINGVSRVAQFTVDFWLPAACFMWNYDNLPWLPHKEKINISWKTLCHWRVICLFKLYDIVKYFFFVFCTLTMFTFPRNPVYMSTHHLHLLIFSLFLSLNFKKFYHTLKFEFSEFKLGKLVTPSFEV